MVKRHLKNLILYKLVESGGATPAGTARAENPFFCAIAKKLVGAVPAESILGTETNFEYVKNHHFPREENDDFCFVTASFIGLASFNNMKLNISL